MKRIVFVALLAMSAALAQVPFASDVAVTGKVTATDLVQGSLLRSSANGGLWGIQSRAANQVAIMPGTDAAGYSAVEILGAWSATRAATGLLRVYGPATNNWGKYVGLLHDGTSGSLISGEGDLLLSPNWTERLRVAGSSGNVLIGTATDSGYRLDVFGGPARIRNTTVPYLLLQSTGTNSTDGAYLGLQNGNNKNYSIGAYADGRFFLYDAAASRDVLSYTQGSRLSLQPSGGDTLLSASLRVYNGGNDGLSTGYSSIRTNLGSGNMVINAQGGALYFNYDHGTGGTIWSNGAGGAVASMDSAGNLSLNGNLSASGQVLVAGTGGGAVYVNGSASQYLINTSLSGGTANGNYGLYFNKTAETLALWTGSAQRFYINGAGNAYFGGTLNVTGTITGTLSGNATNVTGTVAIANGGTGQTSAASAINALLPTQTGYSGRYLTTNGTAAAWSSAAPALATTTISTTAPLGGGGDLSANRTLTCATCVVTSGSYSDPAWLTISKSKVGLGSVENTALSTWAGSANITAIGTLASGTVPWARLSNVPALSGFTDDISSTSATANKLVKRDSNNYIYGSYFNTAIGDESIVPTSFYSTNDTWIRRVTTANAYKALVNSQAHQINFVYGGSASTNIDATTVNNVWRAHAYTATVSEVACWTDAGTVTLALKDSAGNMVTSATLACSSTGASTTSMNTSNNAITSGEGLGFTTSSVSGVKNLSVSIKYTRAY